MQAILICIPIQAFESVYADKSQFTANEQDLKEVLAQLQNVPVALDSGANKLIVTVDGEQVSLDLGSPEVAAFAAEAAYALYLLELLTENEELRTLVSDDIPDFFSFGFSSIKVSIPRMFHYEASFIVNLPLKLYQDVQHKYGKASSELRAVSSVLRIIMTTVRCEN